MVQQAASKEHSFQEALPPHLCTRPGYDIDRHIQFGCILFRIKVGCVGAHSPIRSASKSNGSLLCTTTSKSSNQNRAIQIEQSKCSLAPAGRWIETELECWEKVDPTSYSRNPYGQSLLQL